MKRIFMSCLALFMLALLPACQFIGGAHDTPPEGTPPADDRPLSEIMEELLEGTELPATVETEITEENFPILLFIAPVEGAEGLASEAMMSASAHSVCLLRLPEGADAGKIAEEIKQNADPRKWICVEAEKTAVLQSGNLILLVMTYEETVNVILGNFERLYSK